VTAAYPEVAAALATLARDAIFDGEIVAIRDERVQPFRTIQARLQRKVVEESLRAEVPVAYIVFDLLALDGDLLIDEALSRRRERLADLFAAGAHLKLSPFDRFDESTPAQVNERFEAARARGNEGLMLKRAAAPYLPGRRGKWWLKLKRELSTLDVVVVAVEWGHGKRSAVLSDYTFAVRGKRGALLTIGKAYSGLTDSEIAALTPWYSGLTDSEIAALTPWFLDHRLPIDRQRAKARSHEIPVEPKIVLEVAFDIIAESDLHESGFSLRFPRIVRIRDDKSSADIDTIERVAEIYREMLTREG
jgi:DNA ligase 1